LKERKKHFCRDARSLRPVQSSVQSKRIHPDGNHFVGPGFVGLDAKILRPDKQMIRFIPINNGFIPINNGFIPTNITMLREI
jgi:hypothetical protein